MPILPTLVSLLTFLSKPQRTFLHRLVKTLCLNTGRATHLQLARQDGPSPRALARWAHASFSFPRIFLTFLQQEGILDHPLALVMDASFLPKSGKKTWGKGRFWNGCANRVAAGREISIVGLLDLQEQTAWPLDIRQTPASLPEEDSRLAFYLKQLQQIQHVVPKSIQTLVVDAGYTRRVFVAGVRALGWNVVGKLRKDANLMYLYEGPPEKRRGPPRKWDGKVAVKTLDRFEEVSPLSSGEEIRTKVVYHNGLGCKVRVVGVRTDAGAYALFYSTNLEHSAEEILSLYRLRFQIEFVFRDAKQHTGLGEDQVRSEKGQALHHGASFLATLVARLSERNAQKEVLSLGTLKRRLQNEAIILRVFAAQGLDPTHAAQRRVLECVQRFGCMAA